MMSRTLARWHRLLLKTEKLLLVALVLSMIGIAVAQILLRNLLGAGLLWADGYTRTSVLWLALLGAMLASRRQRHIAIDVLVRYVPNRWRPVALRIRLLATALVCFVAVWFSAGFVIQEYGVGDMAFADVPSWWCQSAIPFAFTVIGLRYGAAAFLPLTSIERPQP